MKHSHYFKPVAGLQFIDVYRLLRLFEVTDPCLQHAVKKLLVAGGRGGKDISQDVQEAIDTLERWKEMRAEDLARLAPDAGRRVGIGPDLVAAERSRMGILLDGKTPCCRSDGQYEKGGDYCREFLSRGHCTVKEPAAGIEDDSPRQQAIGQNGNDGAVYSELDRLQAAEDFNSDIPAGAQPVKEPQRPRHLCATCSQGHATHQCTAGQQEPAKPARGKPDLPSTDDLVDPSGKPSWNNAPNWAMWLAQDRGGVWTFYKNEPHVVGNGWFAIGPHQVFNSGEVVGNWKESLEAAPGRTVT